MHDRDLLIAEGDLIPDLEPTSESRAWERRMLSAALELHVRSDAAPWELILADALTALADQFRRANRGR